MADIRIRKVHFMKNFELDITLSNGHRIIYDLKPKLVTARFKAVEEEDVFQNGEIINGGVIRWDWGTELSLEEILLNVNHSGL